MKPHEKLGEELIERFKSKLEDSGLILDDCYSFPNCRCESQYNGTWWPCKNYRSFVIQNAIQCCEVVLDQFHPEMNPDERFVVSTWQDTMEYLKGKL